MDIQEPGRWLDILPVASGKPSLPVLHYHSNYTFSEGAKSSTSGCIGEKMWVYFRFRKPRAWHVNKTSSHFGRRVYLVKQLDGSLNQFLIAGNNDRLGACADPEFSKEVINMPCYRTDGEIKLGSNLPIRFPRGDQL